MDLCVKTSLNYPPELLGLFLGSVLPKSLSLECSSPRTAKACSTAATGGTAVSSSWGGTVCKCSSDSTTASRLLLPAHKAHPEVSQRHSRSRDLPLPRARAPSTPSAQQLYCMSHLAGENRHFSGAQRVKKKPSVSTFGRGKLPHNELLPLLPEMVDHVLCLHCELCAQSLQDLQLKAPAGLQAPEGAPCLVGNSKHSSGKGCPCQ